MLEKETERILGLVQQRTIGKNETISVREILAAEIPHSLKVFFRADVERILNDELKRARTHSRFNYHQREVDSLQRQMNSILVLDFSLLREEFLQKLDDGIHLALNFLLRPQWTLTSFLFNTNASIGASDLRQMLTYFGAYDYLKEVLLRYVEEKNVPTMTMIEFQRLLWRIDAEYVRRKSAGELAQMTMPIFEFVHFNPGAAQAAAGTLPTRAIAKFFEDKRLGTICSRLENSAGRETMSIDELSDLLELAQSSDPDAFVSDETFVRRQAPLEAQPPGPPPPAAQTPGPTAPPLEDLRRLISDEDQRRFMKKIFRRDDLLYTSTLSALNGLSSWKEASAYIDKFLVANDVDPYSSEAVRFSEIVQQRFFPRAARR